MYFLSHRLAGEHVMSMCSIMDSTVAALAAAAADDEDGDEKIAAFGDAVDKLMNEGIKFVEKRTRV